MSPANENFRLAIFLAYTVLWQGFIWGMFGWAVFVDGHSGWWILLTVFLSGCQYKPGRFGIKDLVAEADEREEARKKTA